MYSSHFAKRSMLLDCIRCVAIVMVLVYHLAAYYDTTTLDPIAHWFYRYGFYGVDLFFPLSGYLITGYLLRSTRPDYVRSFFLRRVFRILPLYLAAVTIFVVAALATGQEANIIDRVWIVYLFLTGWFVFFDGVTTVPYTVTWSLSVEEFAYILFGLFAWINRKRFGLFLAFMIIGPTLLRIPLHLAELEYVYYLPPARVDSIAIGGLAAFLMHHGQTRLPLKFAIAAGIFWAVSLLGTLWAQVFFASALACLVCAAMTTFEARLKDVRHGTLLPFALIGFYSYFIYLMHQFVIFVVVRGLSIVDLNQFWIAAILSLAITYVMAVVSYRFFEGPMIDFGRRLENRERAKPDGANV